MLGKRICVVVLSVVCHGRAIPLLWKALEHPSANVSVAVSIGLLQKADRLLAGFGAITLLADHAFPCAELLGWLENQPGWSAQAGGPALQAGNEFSATGPGCSVDARLRRQAPIHGLAADPTPGARALHPKP